MTGAVVAASSSSVTEAIFLGNGSEVWLYDGAKTTEVAYGTDGYNMRGGCYSPQLKLWVLVGSQRQIVVSADDGYTWTVLQMAWGTTFDSVTWSPEAGEFVLVGSSGYSGSSPDGYTWTQISRNSTYDMRQVQWLPELNTFVAGSGSQSGTLYLRAPGGAWTQRSTAASSYYFYVLATTGGGRLAAGGTSGAFTTSVNLTSFPISFTGLSSGFDSLAFSPTLLRWLAVLPGNAIPRYSSDSLGSGTWVNAATLNPARAREVAWSSRLGCFLYAGYSSTVRWAGRSPDGAAAPTAIDLTSPSAATYLDGVITRG